MSRSLLAGAGVGDAERSEATACGRGRYSSCVLVVDDWLADYGYGRTFVCRGRCRIDLGEVEVLWAWAWNSSSQANQSHDQAG